MFAVINQSKAIGLGSTRQVAVIPHDNEVLLYTRVLAEGKTKQRGSSGSWIRLEPSTDVLQTLSVEDAVGTPVAIEITDSDVRDLKATVGDVLKVTKPTTLLQKLGRAVQDISLTPTHITLDDVVSLAVSDPTHLDRYTKRNNSYLNIQRGEETLVAPAVAVETATVYDTETGRVVQNGVPKYWAHLEVPSSDKVHYPREFDGLPEDRVFDIGLAKGDRFLLTGDAGTGKTQASMNLARRLGVPFLQLVLHKTLDNSIVEGRLLPDPNGSGWAWHYSKFATALTQPSVILLNELSRSALGNTTLFLPVLEEGLLHIETINEVIKVHTDCSIIADQNIGTAYSGAQQQDSALLDRFNVKLEFDYDPAIERKIVGSGSLVELAESLRYLRKAEPAKHKTVVGTRMLINFADQAKHYNFAFAVRSLLNNFPDKEREAVSLQLESRYITIAEELGVSADNLSF